MSDDVVTNDEVNELPIPATETEEVASLTDQTQNRQEELSSEVEKTFTQSELDAIIQKRVAKAEAKAERTALKAYKETLERLIPPPQAEKPIPVTTQTEAPNLEDFSDFNEYQRASNEYIKKETLREIRESAMQADHQEQQNKQNAILRESWNRKMADAEKDIPDIAETLKEANVTLSSAAESAVIDSDNGPKVFHYIAMHPEFVEKLALLSPPRQAAEILKLDEKFNVKKVSNAPAPPAQISGNGIALNGDLSKARSQAEYKELRAKDSPRWSR